MNKVIQVTADNDAKAWGILVRHSPGQAYPNRIFVVSEEAVEALRKAGIQFTELPKDAVHPQQQVVVTGERV